MISLYKITPLAYGRMVEDTYVGWQNNRLCKGEVQVLILVALLREHHRYKYSHYLATLVVAALLNDSINISHSSTE